MQPIGLLKFGSGGNFVFKLQDAETVGYKYYYPTSSKGKFGFDITGNVKSFQDGVYADAAKYQQRFNLDSATYQRLGKLAVALMGRESSFSNFQNRKGYKPADLAEAYHNIAEAGQQARNVAQNVASWGLNWIPGVNIPKTEVGWNPKVASRGSTQIKFPEAGTTLRDLYDSENITKNSLEGGDYYTQGKATMLKLLDLYNQYRNDIDAGIFRDALTRASDVTQEQDDKNRRELYKRYITEKKNNTLAEGLYTLPSTSEDEYWKRKPLDMETVLGQLWQGVSKDGIFNMSANGKYTGNLNKILHGLSTTRPKNEQGVFLSFMLSCICILIIIYAFLLSDK